MWENILKATATPPKGTSVKDIKSLLISALTNPINSLEKNLSKLITKIREAEKKISDEVSPLTQDIRIFEIADEGENPTQHKIDIDAKKALEGKWKKQVEKFRLEIIEPLNVELLELKKLITKTLTENSSNPFTPTMTKKPTNNSEAVYSKQGVEGRKRGKDWQISDDGYGNNDFYNYKENGKSLPISIDEAAQHYKDRIVDYGKEVPFEEYAGGRRRAGGRRQIEDKTYAEPKSPIVIESREEGKKLRAKTTRDRLKDSKNYKPTMLKPKVKKLPKNRMTQNSNDIQSDFKTVSSIRTILYPKSNSEINNIILGFDAFLQEEPSPIIDKFREEEPEKFQEVMDILQSIVGSSPLPVENYMTKLSSLVRRPTGSREQNNTKITFKGGNIKIGPNLTYRHKGDLLQIPVNFNPTEENFTEISNWLGKEGRFMPLPEVSNKVEFIKRFISQIYSSEEQLDSIGNFAEVLTSNNDFIAGLKRKIPTVGQQISASKEKSIFLNYINSARYQKINFKKNISLFLHRLDTIREALTDVQVEKLNNLLSESVGSGDLEDLILSSIELPIIRTQNKKDESLSSKFGAKQTVIKPEYTASLSTLFGRDNIDRPDDGMRELFNLPPNNPIEDNWEPIIVAKISENQKRLLDNRRKIIGVQKPIRQQDIDEGKRARDKLKRSVKVLTEEAQEKIYAKLELEYEKMIKPYIGEISYEPYAGRKQRLLGVLRTKGQPPQINYESLKVTGARTAAGEKGKKEEEEEEGVKKADISSLSSKKRREVKAVLQNAHPTEYFGEDYLRLGKVINTLDGLAKDEEAVLLEKLGVKNLQMVKTAASLRKKYENLYDKLYNMVYDEEE
tara:strand:- start:941 stop:3481 length:2541 start_codon:yes stop_codon:yes gene_type:complete